MLGMLQKFATVQNSEGSTKKSTNQGAKNHSGSWREPRPREASGETRQEDGSHWNGNVQRQAIFGPRRKLTGSPVHRGHKIVCPFLIQKGGLRR